jgi:hypothetical protein
MEGNHRDPPIATADEQLVRAAIEEVPEASLVELSEAYA